MRIKCFYVFRVRKHSIHFVYTFIEFILLLIKVSYFPHYKKYIFLGISFSTFSEVLTAFIYAKYICNLETICLGVNILRSKTIS